MPTVKLKARYGTFVRQDNPEFEFFNYRTYLAVRSGSPQMLTYLYFTNPFPAVSGIRVTSAKLKLWMQGGTTNAGTWSINAQRVARGMNFYDLNYTNRPQLFSGSTYSVQTTGPLSAKHRFEIDVTADLAAVASGGTFYGYTVSGTNPFTIMLYGANHGSYQPELEVTYTQPPTMPRDMSPSAGRVVSHPQPYLTWNYYDVSGSEHLSAVRVQVNTSNSWGSPLWDSGTVLTTEAGLDLADTSYPATAEGGLRYWRAQVRSAAGVWSDWSVPTSFRYRERGTVTITNPGTTFSDPTPALGWTFSSPSGAAQARWNAYVQLVNSNGSYTIWDRSGIRTGDATSWTPKALPYFQSYRFAVDVFDTYDREDTPGPDGTFALARRTATYVPSSGTPSAANFTATTQYPRPEVSLEWTRAEQPDFWVVRRDGVILHRVPGGDFRVGTTNNYQVTDYAPRGEHTWDVRPVVNNSTGLSVSASATVDFIGTWLYDSDGAAVCFQNERDTHDMTMPENTAVHEPLGSDRAVVVTQALRGYEGTLTGLMTELKGQDETPAQWRANLLAMKANPEALRTLVIEDMAFPVSTSQIQVRHAPTRYGWTGSFQFYQQGELLFDPLED